MQVWMWVLIAVVVDFAIWSVILVRQRRDAGRELERVRSALLGTIERQRRQSVILQPIDRMRVGDLAETAVVGIAVLFSPEADGQQSDATRELLTTPLCSPWDGLAEATENNRRLLGLEPVA